MFLIRCLDENCYLRALSLFRPSKHGTDLRHLLVYLPDLKYRGACFQLNHACLSAVCTSGMAQGLSQSRMRGGSTDVDVVSGSSDRP